MKKFGTVRLFFLLILVLSLSVIPTIGGYFANNDTTKERLFGNEAEEMGVLVVWNVDTFEGGNMGKSSILESVSRQFEQQNKGAFVLVLNLTPDEFLMKIENETPDVVSFGYGLFDKICENSLELGFNANLLDNVSSGAMTNNKVFAYPWCLGAYFLLATEESLSKAGATSTNLVDNCMEFGYEKVVGKKTRQVFSLEMGTNAFCSAKDALLKQVDIKDGSIDDAWQNQSFYDAYVGFVNGKSTFLLGTQRDVARLENKKSQGVIQDFYGEALLSTDLVQYIAAVKTENSTKEKLSKKFCAFMLSNIVQQKLLDFGFLPSCKLKNVECESKILLKTYENISKMSISAIN